MAFPGRAVIAQWLFFASAALALVSGTALATTILATPPQAAAPSFSAIGNGADYIVWATLDADIDDVVHGEWRAAPNASAPDKIMVLFADDVPSLLRGEAIVRKHETAEIGARTGTFTWTVGWQGSVHVPLVRDPPSPTDSRAFPWRCDDCIDGRPAVAWMRGKAWVGSPTSVARTGAWSVDAQGRAAGDAPILFRAIAAEHNFDLLIPRLSDVTLGAGAVSLLALGWWGLEARTRRSPSSHPPAEVGIGSEELLRLVDLSERYLSSLHRQYLFGGAVILVAALGLGAFIIPPGFAAARQHLLDPFYAQMVILLAPPFAAVAGLAIWARGLRRLRKERRRWQSIRSGFDEATRDILSER